MEYFQRGKLLMNCAIHFPFLILLLYTIHVESVLSVLILLTRFSWDKSHMQFSYLLLLLCWKKRACRIFKSPFSAIGNNVGQFAFLLKLNVYVHKQSAGHPVVSFIRYGGVWQNGLAAQYEGKKFKSQDFLCGMFHSDLFSQCGVYSVVEH